MSKQNKPLNRKWRNPYAPIPSKKLSEQVADVSLAISPKKTLPAVDLRTSVSKMRSNIKGISSTIRQVEETMDTLYGAMEMFENLGKRTSSTSDTAGKNEKGEKGEKGEKAEKQPSAKRRPPVEAPKEVEESPEAETGGGSPLGNIDIGQILGLLQSPLVQNLLSQTVNGSGSKQRKKEG